MVDEISNIGLPIWVLAVAFLLNAFKGYLPMITQNNTEKNGVAECKNRCLELSKQLIELKKECEEVNIKYDDISKKYYLLLGSVSVIKTRLKEMGFDDITLLSKVDG